MTSESDALNAVVGVLNTFVRGEEAVHHTCGVSVKLYRDKKIGAVDVVIAHMWYSGIPSEGRLGFPSWSPLDRTWKRSSFNNADARCECSKHFKAKDFANNHGTLNALTFESPSITMTVPAAEVILRYSEGVFAPRWRPYYPSIDLKEDDWLTVWQHMDHTGFMPDTHLPLLCVFWSGDYDFGILLKSCGGHGKLRVWLCLMGGHDRGPCMRSGIVQRTFEIR